MTLYDVVFLVQAPDHCYSATPISQNAVPGRPCQGSEEDRVSAASTSDHSQ